MPAGAAQQYKLSVSLTSPSLTSKSTVGYYTFKPTLTPRIGSVSPDVLRPGSTNMIVTLTLSLPQSAEGPSTADLAGVAIVLKAGYWSEPATQVRVLMYGDLAQVFSGSSTTFIGCTHTLAYNFSMHNPDSDKRYTSKAIAMPCQPPEGHCTPQQNLSKPDALTSRVCR
jgi:hypothetical protein